MESCFFFGQKNEILCVWMRGLPQKKHECAIKSLGGNSEVVGQRFCSVYGEWGCRLVARMPPKKNTATRVQEHTSTNHRLLCHCVKKNAYFGDCITTQKKYIFLELKIDKFRKLVHKIIFLKQKKFWWSCIMCIVHRKGFFNFCTPHIRHIYNDQSVCKGQIWTFFFAAQSKLSIFHNSILGTVSCESSIQKKTTVSCLWRNSNCGFKIENNEMDSKFRTITKIGAWVHSPLQHRRCVLVLQNKYCQSSAESSYRRGWWRGGLGQSRMHFKGWKSHRTISELWEMSIRLRLFQIKFSRIVKTIVLTHSNTFVKRIRGNCGEEKKK